MNGERKEQPRDNAARKLLWKDESFLAILDRLLEWRPSACQPTGNKEEQRAALASDEKFRSFVDQFSKWYPPIYPRVETGFQNPVTPQSPLQVKLIVEYFADCFQREMIIDFGLLSLRKQFDATSQSEFEAWLCVTPDGIFPRETQADIATVNQVCCFTNDAPKSAAELAGSSWVLRWVWTCPNNRGKGQLQKGWKMFEERYGNFFLCGPLSPRMLKFCDHKNIGNDRILDPEE